MTHRLKQSCQRRLEDGQIRFNHGIDQIRYVVERAIANMKTWRILHTECRVPKEKA
ncbi:transposase family protein [Corynebacterium durum]|uniref:transposase family protein n=1 Tax=Corynebacterium durum TaxID=61592 RepID=UPI0036F3B32A